MILKMLIFGLLLASFACSRHGLSESEFPSRSVIVNGSEYKYRIYVPKDRVPGQKIPVMLYLHGSNRRGDDNESQVEDLRDVIRSDPEYFPYVVVFPQCGAEAFWSCPMIEQALGALDQTIAEFDGDNDRLYLAGYSMGGFGVWHTAIAHPDKFAALVPVAGGVEPLGVIDDKDRSLLSPEVVDAASSGDTYKAYAAVLTKTPAWIVHGADDGTVPVAASRKMFAAMQASGDPSVVYKELKGVGHGSVTTAFRDPELVKWLADRRR
ncbi:MAG: prolyl oligopeptidase family serine peptidase [Acidobacteriota bacterium]